ncbi:MAG: hypothetical protein IKZ28_01255 [Clostridia bacterium]|nr:hypothetical protein [Clostridia bacterium]
MDLQVVLDENTLGYNLYNNGSSSYYQMYYEENTYGEETHRSYYVRDGIDINYVEVPNNATNVYMYNTYFSYTYYDNYAQTSYTVYSNYQGGIIYKVDTGAYNYYSHNVSVRGSLFILTLRETNTNGTVTNYYIAK